MVSVAVLFLVDAARVRLERAMHDLSSRAKCRDLTLAELAGAHCPGVDDRRHPFPTTDEVPAELVRDLGRDPAHNEYAASFT